MNYCVIPAAGIGTRMRAGKNKMFLHVGGRPVLFRTLVNVERAGCFDLVVISAHKGEERIVAQLARSALRGTEFRIVTGGTERQDSVYNALMSIDTGYGDMIAIHDGARCLATPSLIRRCVEAAREYGAAAAGKPSTDTVKSIDGDAITGTIDRRGIALIETPQVFRADLILPAYEQARRDGFSATDDCSLVERMGVRPRLVPSEEPNIKITTKGDLSMSNDLLLSALPRVGTGFDVHRFADGRRLILGGVEIPCERGLLGHSDADVLAHAIIDAVFGAAALPDIGRAFPDNDPAYKDANSMALLKTAVQTAEKAGFAIGNIDATVIAQAPKLAPYIEAMRENIASVCGADLSAVSVKATTTEKLGFTGRGEGIAAEAAVVLARRRA
ncbi:MAG: bifunctional 2-C-methyl-D-erythritol 4-phosphate cytidylyltransferase/2-C-methyl-D-erythritol 2,4-cyclodiphosphate synthase [Clostridiales bacterium]|nr:MAG: bifunctional 2-C-methyl-D-erythritol 4-phosphate cytidylyltransferase/2-C-methyl-D-erythritol 2,4-cyclodiphosphate synthase [Clostridiales bacterium]